MTDDPGACTFCSHPYAEHTGNTSHTTGCASQMCPNPTTANVGRCAVYTSPEAKRHSDMWFALVDKPTVITAQEVADRIHNYRHDSTTGHGLMLSCGCMHEAISLLWGFA